MNHHPEHGRTPLVLVTGHTFGVRAFEGVFSSPAFLDGRIEVPLMIGLDHGRAPATVGYQSPERLAAEQGVRYTATADGRLASLAAQIRAARPAYLLVIGWSHLIGPEILSIPAAGNGFAAADGSFGCIGMHPTRLPHGRGQAPIPWTIIKRVATTALSVFFLEAGADTGPVIAQYELDVHPRETAASLFYRVAHAHFTAGRELAEGLGRRRVAARAQDRAAATRWPRRRPADGEILATMTGQEIDALVRGLLGPYPRAFVTADGQPLTVHGVEAAGGTDGIEAAGGTGGVAPDGGRVRFLCADGAVDLLVHGPGEQPH